MRGSPLFIALLGASSAPAVAQAVSAQLTPSQIVTLAERYLNDGRIDDAAVLVEGLATHEDGGSQRLFLQGLIAVERKQYRDAERSFRHILRDEPNAPRVRLELARTLYLAQDWSASEYQFRLADAAALPVSTHQIITRFRQQIRERRRWTATVELGLAPDTNINQSTDNDVAVIYGRPFQLNPDARRRSGIGATLSAAGEVRVRRRPDSAVVISGFTNIVEYGGSTFDDHLIGGAIGRQQRLAKGRITVSGTGFHRWYGDHPYATGYGVRTLYEAPVGHWQSTIQLSAQRIVYQRSPVQSGVSLTGGLGVGHALTASSYGTAQIALSRQTARDPGFAFIDAGAVLNYYRELPGGVSGGLEATLNRTLYDAAIPAYGALPRSQWRGRAGISLAKRDWLFAGFAPAIRISQSLLRSNIRIYEYDRRRVELTIVRPL